MQRCGLQPRASAGAQGSRARAGLTLRVLAVAPQQHTRSQQQVRSWIDSPLRRCSPRWGRSEGPPLDYLPRLFCPHRVWRHSVRQSSRMARSELGPTTSSRRRRRRRRHSRRRTPLASNACSFTIVRNGRSRSCTTRWQVASGRACPCSGWVLGWQEHCGRVAGLARLSMLGGGSIACFDVRG